MKLVFDTSTLSVLLDNNQKMLDVVNSGAYRQLVIPLAADAELRYGYRYGNRERYNLQIYEGFVADFGVGIAAPDQQTSVLYAELAAWCRKHGVSLSNNDLWIAATCVQNAGWLLTTDDDFKHLPQLRLVPLEN